MTNSNKVLDAVISGAKVVTTTLKVVTRLFTGYETRVLRGLVGTGDGMSKEVKKFLADYKKGKRKLGARRIRYLNHFSRKWDADRSKLK